MLITKLKIFNLKRCNKVFIINGCTEENTDCVKLIEFVDEIVKVLKTVSDNLLFSVANFSLICSRHSLYVYVSRKYIQYSKIMEEQELHDVNSEILQFLFEIFIILLHPKYKYDI